MKKLLLSFFAMLVTTVAMAQYVSAKWELGDINNLGATVTQGDGASLISTSYLNGTNIAKADAMTVSSAATGYTAVTYEPAFTMYYVDTKQTARTAGRCVSFGVTPQAGHTFKPTRLSFDAAKCGTDGGNFDVVIKPSGGSEISLADAVDPLRNTVKEGNPNAYSHHEYVINDQLVDGKAFIVILYIYNINGVDATSPKSIAFRNVQLEGVIDEPIFTAEHYVSSLTCKDAQDGTLTLTSLLNGQKNGATTAYPTKLQGEPKDFQIAAQSGYTATCSYNNKTAFVTVKEDDNEVFGFNIRFTVSNRPQKPAATPLKRGLMAVSLSGASMGTGNLVSWRTRESDPEGVKFKLYRGTSAEAQTTALSSGKFITGKSNLLDTGGNTSSYYKLEVYNANDELLETEVSGKTWKNQSLEISLGDTPKDPDHGASYTPNDASFCDMDGDGEYEIILKWSPDNEKDAASSGTTSSPYFDCLKMDGTRLWRIRLGDNFFTSAHTIQFIAWDLDGDGYGEFMCKTAPGTIDGKGNYVLLGNDNPNENLLSGRGKQDHGPEYITVFDGMTGEEISTIPYHTDFKTGQNYWGDSNQNRSERYLAALAYLDGYDKNPSPIFARGYYSGAFIGAYDFDGEQLKERWVHRAYAANNGVVEYGDGTKKTINKTVYGDGAHWIAVADCDGDGKQEIIYGSSCLDDDGTTLYRTGMGHGDALHVSDFVTDRPGLEVLMCHEHKPYGIDIRDAKTGEILLRQEESGDTGRGLAAHFDSSQKSAQFLTSGRAQMFNMADGSVNGASWALGSSGAGINCRVYWDGDPFDEFFDKSIIAHWNPTGKSFDRFRFNNGNYLWGKLNNYSKNNPCVLGDILGDWREEIVTWDGDATTGYHLLINATHYDTKYALPHLMDDPQYRVQVVNQNCCYNQPPHLSYDPAVRLGVIDPYAPVVYDKSIEPGKYYIQNASTKKFLLAGSSWGTRVIQGDHAIEFDLTLVGDYKYNIDSNISNGGANHYLGTADEPFLDSAPAQLTIKKSVLSYSIFNGTSYLTSEADGSIKFSAASASLSKSKWNLLTKEAMIKSLDGAVDGERVDATFLIQDPNFGRNDQRASAWNEKDAPTIGGDKDNSENCNFNAERWGGNTETFTVQQTITLPNGWYRLSAQGFYRYNNTADNNNNVAIAAHADGTEKIHSYLFAGDVMQPLCSVADDSAQVALEVLPNTQAEAATAFDKGLYHNHLDVEVKDGKLAIGVKKTAHEGCDWTVFDNFELYYYGASNPKEVETGITNAVFDTPMEKDAIYTIHGVKLQTISSPGIYIRNGKKILVK